MTELMGPHRVPWKTALERPKRLDWSSQRPRGKPEGQQDSGGDDLGKLKPGESDHGNAPSNAAAARITTHGDSA